MNRFLTIGALGSIALLGLVTAAGPAAAADSPVGTYLKKVTNGKSLEMTLKIEEWGPGRGKLTWNIKAAKMVLTVVSTLDGKEAPVLLNGAPMGETMAITRIDNLHSSTVVKMDGKPFGTSKGTFSPDFKTLSVENDFASSVGGNQAGKSTELWVRQ